VIHEAPGIQRALTSECKDPSEAGRHRLKCEGVNLQVLCQVNYSVFPPRPSF